MKRLFVAATRQNDGKTSVSLGLVAAFKDKFKHIGFIKPVGQRYVIEEGVKVDKDSVLMKRIFGFSENLKDMNPISVPAGFTEEYILRGKKEDLIRQVEEAFSRVCKDKDFVLIEGTGHAGVGSVFDLSNAAVAKLLKAKVVLVSRGGIGRPIDEIVLNKTLFEKEGVEMVGVIINKVLPEKQEKIEDITRKGLERKGIKLFGVIPYREYLTGPCISQVAEELNGKVLCGGERLENRIGKIIVGAMGPHRMLGYLENDCLIITPGDREDVILTTMSYHLSKAEQNFRISGLVLSGGINPHQTVMDLLKTANIPVVVAEEDTYTVASKVHDLKVKIRPNDKEKIDMVTEMISKYVNMEELCDSL